MINKIIISIFCKKYFVYICVFFAATFSLQILSAEEDIIYDKSMNKRHEDISQLKYIPVNTYALTNDEINSFYINDVKTIKQMGIKLFYSMGKIYGYAVFINNDNNNAVISDVELKLKIYINNDHITLYFQITKEQFRKIVLSKGGTIIGFPLDDIKYKDLPRKGSSIIVEAECFHLKDSLKIFAD